MRLLIVPMAAMAETSGPFSRCRLLAESAVAARIDAATCIAEDVNYSEINDIKNYFLDVPAPLGMPEIIASKVFPVAQKLGITSRKTVKSFDEVLWLTGNSVYGYLVKSVASIRKGMLRSQKGSNDAFYLLRLLYPHLDYSCEIHQDHMHPKSIFENTEELRAIMPNEDFDFASDPQNWNSVLNLQNLNQFSNTSKQDKPLAQWAKEQTISNQELYLKPETSLDIVDFKKFIEDRMEVLIQEIQNLI